MSFFLLELQSPTSLEYTLLATVLLFGSNTISPLYLLL